MDVSQNHRAFIELKSVRRWIRENFKGLQARNLQALYAGLLDLSTEPRLQGKHWGVPDICLYSGLDRNSVAKLMPILEEKGIIQRQQVRDSKGHKRGTEFMLTNEEVQPESGIVMKDENPKSRIVIKDTTGGAIRSHTSLPKSGFRVLAEPPLPLASPSPHKQKREVEVIDQSSKLNVKEEKKDSTPAPSALKQKFKHLPEAAAEFDALKFDLKGLRVADTVENSFQFNKILETFGADSLQAYSRYLKKAKPFWADQGWPFTGMIKDADAWMKAVQRPQAPRPQPQATLEPAIPLDPAIAARMGISTETLQ